MNTVIIILAISGIAFLLFILVKIVSTNKNSEGNMHISDEYVIVKNDDWPFNDMKLVVRFIPKEIFNELHSLDLKHALNGTTSPGVKILKKDYDKIICNSKEYVSKKVLADRINYENLKHCNLADEFFKERNIDKSIYHAKLSMINGHNTGHVQKRLSINLEKELMINQAIQLCDIVISEKFHFSKNSGSDKDDFKKRKIRLLKKLDKAIDNPSDKLFSDEETQKIFTNIDYFDFY